MSDLVTGEAVVLELQLARTASRGLALAVDVLVQAAVLLVFFVVLTLSATSLDSAAATAIALVVSVAVLVGYPVTFETLTRGRTLGKMAMGLRAVREDGGPIGFRQALVRGLAGFFVDFWGLGLLGAVAVVVSLSSAKSKRVGDFLAGTVVIRERLPKQRAAAVHMPPELAGWATALDLSRLGDDLALAVRQYLGRFEELNSGARSGLGHALTVEVSRHVNLSPPPGFPEPTYLAAVLAERRLREERRLGLTPPGWQQPAQPIDPPTPPTPPTPPSGSPFSPPS